MLFIGSSASCAHVFYYEIRSLQTARKCSDMYSWFVFFEHHYHNGGRKEENIKNINVSIGEKNNSHTRPYDLKALLNTVPPQVLQRLRVFRCDPATTAHHRKKKEQKKKIYD